MGELVALETQNVANDINNPEEDCVDFVAATTASLGVPSPSLSRVKSFDDSPHSVSDEKKERKGDLQEEEELLKALQLSVTNSPTTIESKTDSDLKTPESVIPEKVHTGAEHENEKALKLSETESLTTAVNEFDSDPKKPESVIPEELHTGENNDSCIQKPSTDNDNNGMNKSNDDLTFETVPSQEVCSSSQGDNDKIHNTGDESVKGNDVNVEGNVESVGETLDDMSSCLSAPIPGLESSKGKDGISSIDESKVLTSSVDESEPIYEGEEHIQETSTTANYENGEPMYEGEVVLAEQVDKGKDGITPKQGKTLLLYLVINIYFKTIN